MEDIQSVILKHRKFIQSSYLQDFLPLINKQRIKVGNLNNLIEKVLVSRLLAGDRSAFSIIFNAYYKDLVLFAASFSHDLDNAEEIVQDAFVKLWEEHESIKINSSLKSYLLKIVQNKCIDCYRHTMVMRSHIDFMTDNLCLIDYETDNYILYSELQEQLEAALNKLPEEISEVFKMNRNKGLKYKEIAELLGVSVRTVEVRIGKALHTLRYHLREYLFIIACMISLLVLIIMRESGSNLMWF